MKSRSLVLLLTVVALAAGGVYWRSRASSVPVESVATAEAVRGDVEDTVLATGSLQPQRQVSVGAQVSGRVVSLKVVLGQKVAEGDLIAEIDGVNLQNALRSAIAAVEALKAQREEKQASLAYAQSSLARQKQMIGQNAISRDAYEIAETSVRTTTAQIAALDAQIDQGQVQIDTAKTNLAYTRITAPIAGTVLGIVALEGQTVNAVQSAPTIVVLGDVATMTVKAKISEADVVRVKPGQEAFFTILGEPERRRPAKLISIEPAPESIKTDNATSSSSTSSSSSSSSTSTAIYYNGLFNVPNPDGALLTSMTAQVNVVIGRAKNVVTIPSVALRRRGREMFVDVVGAEGGSTPRKVKVGLDNRITAEISEGLEAGERVVIGRGGGAAAGGPPGGRRPSPMGF